MNLTCTTPSTVLVVSVAEAKAHCRVENDQEDAQFEAWIKAATSYCENVTRRQLTNATWALRLDSFESTIRLPMSPISSVSSIVYTDTAGTTQTLSSAVYTVDSYDDPAKVVEAYSQSWPSTRDIPNAVVVAYIAGYGAAGSNVPEPIRQAILLLVNGWYEHRSAVLTGTISKEIEFAVESLLHPYRQQWEF